MKTLYEENKKIEYIFAFIDYPFLRKKPSYICVKNGHLPEKTLSLCSL